MGFQLGSFMSQCFLFASYAQCLLSAQRAIPAMAHPKVLESCVGSMCCALAKCTADFKDAARTAKIGSAAMGRRVQWAIMNSYVFFPDAVVAKGLAFVGIPLFPSGLTWSGSMRM